MSPPIEEPAALAPALERATAIPSRFAFNEVRASPRTTGTPPPAPPLGPLAAFTGDWHGNGFNTIFRPDNPQTPSSDGLPRPLSPSDNVLELNLTVETLSFSGSLGAVPNRGREEGDIFLNGVPYLQSIEDVTTAAPVGIHLEPGLWMAVPSTTDPREAETVVRMASIPHGTTICAQGTFRTLSGAPTIPAAPITPFLAAPPGTQIPFPSQNASDSGQARIPQDLTAFIAAGTITQAVLDDPAEVLRAHNHAQDIVATTEIGISTQPEEPLFGGGTDNIAFLLGDSAAVSQPAGPGQNAQTVRMKATFWIEEVRHTIVVPPFRPGGPPLHLSPEPPAARAAVPRFLVRPPIAIAEPRPIVVTSKQIQYLQVVELNFAGLSWPHVSVATLVPSGLVPVPPSGWST